MVPAAIGALVIDHTYVADGGSLPIILGGPLPAAIPTAVIAELKVAGSNIDKLIAQVKAIEAKAS